MQIYNFSVKSKSYEYNTTIKDLLCYWFEDTEIDEIRRDKFFNKYIIHGCYETLNVNKQQGY